MNFIRPYLTRLYTNYDASMYIISLLLDGLKVQGRELRERIKSNGAFEDNKFVIDECVALVSTRPAIARRLTLTLSPIRLLRLIVYLA